MKTSIEKRRKNCIFPKGLVHGFRQKSEKFLWKIDREKVSY